MAATVYLETSIFSFYHDQRGTPAIVARRDWTRAWWRECSADFELVTSAAVLDELAIGTLPHRDQAFRMAREIPVVPVSAGIQSIAAVYIQHRLMPKAPYDALHLALASFHKCDYLLTWNCQHMANAKKFGHLRWVNATLGLHVPALVTPLELMGGEK